VLDAMIFDALNLQWLGKNQKAIRKLTALVRTYFWWNGHHI